MYRDIKKRSDRWELMLDCKERDEIPHGFTLPKMSPEKQDVNVKIFVRGRQAEIDKTSDNVNKEKCSVTPINIRQSTLRPVSNYWPNLPNKSPEL